MSERQQTSAEVTVQRRAINQDQLREQQEIANRGRYLAYAACAWAILFAIPNLYWAAGVRWAPARSAGRSRSERWNAIHGWS